MKIIIFKLIKSILAYLRFVSHPPPSTFAAFTAFVSRFLELFELFVFALLLSTVSWNSRTAMYISYLLLLLPLPFMYPYRGNIYVTYNFPCTSGNQKRLLFVLKSNLNDALDFSFTSASQLINLKQKMSLPLQTPLPSPHISIYFYIMKSYLFLLFTYGFFFSLHSITCTFWILNDCYSFFH